MAHIEEIRDFITGIRLDVEPFVGGILVPSEKIVIQCVDTTDAAMKAVWAKNFRAYCKTFDYRLIVIPEHYWVQRPEAVKARLHVTFHSGGRVHADQTRITILSDGAAKRFLNSYHVDGYPDFRDDDEHQNEPYNSLTHLGLLNKKTSAILAVMTFSDEEIGYDGAYVARYATAGTVIKGAERLFKSYVGMKQPETIYADCDLNWETGGLYYFLGFKPDCYIEPERHFISGWDKFIWKADKFG